MYNKLKDTIRDKIRKQLNDRCNSKTYACFNKVDDSLKSTLYRDEWGFLNCHIIVIASKDTHLPLKIMP